MSRLVRIAGGRDVSIVVWLFVGALGVVVAVLALGFIVDRSADGLRRDR